MALGIDFPDLNVDMKVTSINQPQSSCPFRSAEQKIYGLGHHLIVFVYKRTENDENRTARLSMEHVFFVESRRTADFQTTRRLREILDGEGNEDDVAAFLLDRNLPVDEVGARNLAERIIQERPSQGYPTISNALQWRLAYGRVIKGTDDIQGIERIRRR